MTALLMLILNPVVGQGSPNIRGVNASQGSWNQRLRTARGLRVRRLLAEHWRPGRGCSGTGSDGKEMPTVRRVIHGGGPVNSFLCRAKPMTFEVSGQRTSRLDRRDATSGSILTVRSKRLIEPDFGLESVACSAFYYTEIFPRFSQPEHRRGYCGKSGRVPSCCNARSPQAVRLRASRRKESEDSTGRSLFPTPWWLR